jgi:2-dehydropantoate 2-reductase
MTAVGHPRVAVVGVGAIGSAVASAVANASRAELVLCGRVARERVIVEGLDSMSTVLGPVVADPDAVGLADWVLLAVKAHQTEGALPWLDRLCGPATTVVVFQNGVEHRERLTGLRGGTVVLPAVVWFGAQGLAPDRVRINTPPRVTVPDMPESDALRQLVAPFLEVTVTQDFLTESWLKLCQNAVGGLMALANQPARIFREPAMRALAIAFAEECVAVARAAGARLADGVATEIVDSFARQPPESGSSILADRLAGRPLEWDARNGVIRRCGARHGVATPISDVVVPLLASVSTER